MIALAAGLALGLAGSAHCGAMCGPLALLVDGASAADGGAPRWRRRAAYHAGRLATYAALGAAAGLAGGSVRGAGVGRAVALVAGVALVAQACLLLRGRGPTPASPGHLTRALGRAAAGLKRRAIAHPAVLGALNGLLPCGLIYAAVVAAAGTGGVEGGLALMIGFGLGTVPALLGVSMLAGGVAGRPAVRRVAAPIAIGLAGLMLILRGLAPAVHDHGVAGPVAAAAAAAASASAPAAGHRHP